MQSSGLISVGIDLAGVSHRSTGIATMQTDMRRAEHTIKHTDEEILDYVCTRRPAIIVIDAPLSMPKGRTSLETISNVHFRECDRELARRHVKFFPITLGPMRKLTARGIKIAGLLREAEFSVFEGYPGGAQDILEIPRKGESVAALAQGLRSLGLEFDDKASHDELDAITCAYVGLLHLKGKSELIGAENEGQIVLPLVN